MTEQQKQHAAEVLIHTRELMGGDDPKFLPKIFVVNGHCYLFLNAARRASYNTVYPIEVMTIREAWEIHYHMPADTLDDRSIESDFDQNGSTYEGLLFCDNRQIMANMIPNPVIKMQSNKPDLMEVAEMPINRMFLGIRAQNILMKTKCKTYGDALKFGRETMSKLRNVGVTTISELDAEFDRVGLWNQWKYNKPIK